MQKISSHAAALQHLTKVAMATYEKQAAQAQTDIKGQPNTDVKSESVSDKLETTDQNAVGADKQNDKQEYKQEPSKADNEPLKGAKSASVKELGNDVLNTLKTAALAQTDIKSEPGKDVKSESVSDKLETTDQNAVGADKNKPQEYGQKPSGAENEPIKGAKTAEVIAEKVASFQLGREFAAALMKQSVFSPVSDDNLLKEAGSRDMEILIDEAERNIVPQVDKQAEADGIRYFEEVVKKADAESALARENAELKEKVASFEVKLAELAPKVAATEKVVTDTKAEQEKKAAADVALQEKKAFAAEVAGIVIAQLKNESVTK
jgi:hypothetical protein